MNVRLANKNDAKAMAKLSIMTWKYAYAHILPPDVLKGLSVDKRAERMRQNLERGEPFWIAEMEDKLVGFACIGKNRSKEIEADAEIHSIYVMPSMHGRGIGRTLLKAAMPGLVEKGVRSLVCFAFRDNELARKFYRGLGAEELDESVFNVNGVDYPDQSYYWQSIEVLRERLDVTK